MRRANTSTTNAVYTKPRQVATYVKSETHNWFGWVAVKFRSTRSAGWGPAPACVVVIHARPRRAPARPIAPISRRTVHRATRNPSRRSCFHTLRGPYTWKCSSQTRWISGRSASSRWARAGRRVGSACRAFSRKYVDGAIGTAAQIDLTP